VIKHDSHSNAHCNTERRQTVNIFIVPRQLENELLRNNLFENGVSTLSLENQKTYKYPHILSLFLLHFTLLYFTTEYYILFIFSLFYKPIKPSSVQLKPFGLCSIQNTEVP